MKTLILLLAGGLLAGPAAAQTALEDSRAEELASNVYGFGPAELVTVSGKTFHVFVPLNRYGFSHELPIFRQVSDMRQLSAQPQAMVVDKVLTVRTRTTYLEQMVLAGKSQHVLAVRTVEGPVELFSYIETKRIHMAARGTGLEQNTGYVPNLQKQHWYLRRQGVLTEVQPRGFGPQLTEYFSDDPATVAALSSQQAVYQDLSPLVAAYNQHRAAAH